MNSATPPSARVTAITVSYGSGSVLFSLMDSLKADAASVERVIIADNRGDADVRELADAAGAAYLCLDNPGYGGAVNAAVRRFDVASEWILIVNPDVTFASGTIDQLLAAAGSDETVGSVGPLIRDADGSVYPSARQLPRLTSGTGHALFGKIWPANPWSRAYRRANEEPFERDAEWLSGSCLLVKRTAFEAVGGFDESYFMYFEDVDLGARLLQAGYRNRYAPSAEVTHTGAHSTEKSMSAMIAAHHESAYRFLSRRYPGALRWPVRAGLRLGLMLRSWISRHR